MTAPIADAVDAFIAAISEKDDSIRAALLERSATDDIEFHGLQVTLIGRDEVVAGFGDDGSLLRTSDVEQRGAWIRWRWEFRGPDGVVPIDASGRPYAGSAIARVASDGRLALVVPFQGT